MIRLGEGEVRRLDGLQTPSEIHGGGYPRKSHQSRHLRVVIIADRLLTPFPTNEFDAKRMDLVMNAEQKFLFTVLGQRMVVVPSHLVRRRFRTLILDRHVMAMMCVIQLAERHRETVTVSFSKT
jgi:hypothetical protein